MNNATFIRTLIIYAICVPLAVFLGYELTSPLARSTYYMLGLLVLVLTFPLLLRYHHFLLVASWNLAAVLFFLQGQPPIWMLMVALSLGVSILQRATDKTKRFFFVPQAALPLIFLVGVVLATAHYTGGIGIRALGSDLYGGKRYVILIGSILGYFALTAQRIPPERAGLYIAAFFLGGLTKVIGDLFLIAPGSMEFAFWLFPPNMGTVRGGIFELGTTRLTGTCVGALLGVYFMLSRYGIRGILSIRKPWRVVLFLLFVLSSLLGGFRSTVLLLAMTFTILFFLEGLHRTKWLPAAILSVLLLAAFMFAFAPRLPFTFQRALAFLPLKLDPVAKLDAQYSTDWRLEMWKSILPEVPQYIWLGKGYALDRMDFDFMSTRSQGDVAEDWDAAIAGNYHNGPLSVVLTFGIWGVIAFLWFAVAGIRVLYFNYRYGPPELRTYNALLFTVFVTRFAYFLTIYGTFDSDMFYFIGWLGLSVSLNGGVCRPSDATVSETEQTESLPVIPVRMRTFPG